MKKKILLSIYAVLILASGAIAANYWVDTSGYIHTPGFVGTSNQQDNCSRYASLTAAVSTIGSTSTTLTVDTTTYVTANTTVPANISLNVTKTGLIKKSGTSTLTINGPFSAGLYQVFSGFNKADITFGSSGQRHFEWFGIDSLAAVTVTVSAAGGDFTSLASALAWVKPMYMDRTPIVYIEIDDGTYTTPSTQSDEYWQKLVIKAKNTYSKTISSVQSSSGSAGAWSVILNLNNVTNITVNDYVIINLPTGGTNPTYLCGCHKVTNVDAINSRITISSKHRASAAPSGAVTGPLQVMKSMLYFSSASGGGIHVWNSNVLADIQNIVLVGAGASATGYGIDVQDVGRLFVSQTLGVVDFYYNVFINLNSQINGVGAIVASNAVSHNYFIVVGGTLDNSNYLAPGVSSGAGGSGYYVESGGVGYIGASVSTGNANAGYYATWNGTIDAYSACPTGNYRGFFSDKDGYINTNLAIARESNNIYPDIIGEPYSQTSEEKVINGNFYTSTTSWEPSYLTATIAVIAGGQSGNCLELTYVSGSNVYAEQAVAGLTAGKFYKVSGYIKSGTAGAVTSDIYLGASSQNGYVTVTSTDSWVPVSFITQYQNTGTAPNYLTLRKQGNAAGTLLFDEVSIVEVMTINREVVFVQPVIEYQTAKTSSSGTLDLSSGTQAPVYTVTLSENITTITFPTAATGIKLRIIFKQAAAGGPYTVAGWPATVLLAGGAFTMTGTASKHDTLEFEYHGVSSKWIELSRSQNM